MPFQISSDPAFIWLGEKHKEALATLRYGILDNKGFLLLTGDVGTGKTTLINTLISSLSSEVIYASVPDPRLETIDFFNYVALSFGIEKEFSTKGKFIICLSEFLHNAHRQGKKVLLIIDESQLLSQELLEEIRLLSNINVENSQILNIFFVGQNEFNEVIARDENRAVSNRLTLNYQLSPLTLEETGMYIHHRLLVSGARHKIFKKSAVAEIYEYSGGLPRRINILCDHCLLTGYVLEKKTISAGDVKDSIHELSVPQYESAKKRTDSVTPAVSGDSPPVVSQKRRSGRWGLQFVNLILIIVLLLILVPERVSWFDNWFIDKKPPENTELRGQSDQAPHPADTQQLNGLPQAVQNTLEQRLVTDTGGTGSVSSEEDQDVLQQQRSSQQDDTGAAIQYVASSPSATGRDELSEDIAQDGDVEIVDTLVSSVGQHVADTTEQGGDKEVLSVPEPLIIRFGGNSIDFNFRDQKNVDRFVRYLLNNPTSILLITGHTDSRGAAALNYRLSLYRAEIVKSYFLGKGLSAGQVKVEGHGPDFPMASNDTVQGREMNRRVEVKLLAVDYE